MKKHLIIFILFALSCRILCAKTLYVDKNAVHRNSCSDSYSYDQNGSGGAWTNPFCSVVRAAAVFSAGDSILVADGTYTDRYSSGYMIYLTHGGSSGNLVTFDAENPGGAVLDGQNLNECVSFTKDANYIVIQGFEIKNCSPVGIASNDTPGATNNTIRNNHIHHCSQDGITINHNGNNWIVDRNLIHDIYRYYSSANQYHGVYICGDSSNWKITNNVIYDIPYGWPIQIYNGTQSNGVVANNTFADAVNSVQPGHIIIAATTPNLVIENNIMHKAPNGAAIRSYSDNSVQNVVVRNNLTTASTMCSGDSCSRLNFSNNYTSTDAHFVNADGRDYHLQSGSSAIDAAYNVAGTVDADFDGKRRPQNSIWDIGAYEYVPISPPAGLKVLGTR